MTRDEILAVAKAKGLQAARFESLLQPAAVARFGGGRTDGGGPPSRLGGLPWLPADDAWPRHEGKALSCVAQIHLPDVPAPLAAELPAKGVLSFFYLADDTAWGFDPKDRGKFAVRHFPDAGALRPATAWPAEIADHNRFPPTPITFEPTITIPPWDVLFPEGWKASGKDGKLYSDLEQELAETHRIHGETRLLGHPAQIQGEMSSECALVTGGLYCGDGSFTKDPRYEALRAKAGEWRLLFQLQSHEAAGMCWGDLGCLYYWIPRAALKAGDFDAAWMIFQCS